jgi:hypothetical protein
MIEGLAACFAELADPREARRCDHQLIDLAGMALSRSVLELPGEVSGTAKMIGSGGKINRCLLDERLAEALPSVQGSRRSLASQSPHSSATAMWHNWRRLCSVREQLAASPQPGRKQWP